MKDLSLELNMPVYNGACILSLSKLIMMKFHYNVIKKNFVNVNLCYMDTDSLIYEFPKNSEKFNLWDKLKVLAKNYLDISEYPKNHPLYDPNTETNNKLVPGMFKDEKSNEKILSAVFLRAKQYTIKTKNEKNEIKDIIKAKGVSSNKLNYNLFETVLENSAQFKTGNIEKSEFYTSRNSIRSYNHKIHVIKQEKKALSAFDNKRYINEDGINTKSFGHYSLK